MKNLVFTILISLMFRIGFSQVFDVDTIQYNGSADTLINIVILGDGYTQNQLGQFVKDASDGLEALFNEDPYSNYRNYFNVFLIKVPSNESGAADDPDNLIDNYYGSTYNAYGIERLLVPIREFRVTNVLANNFPSYDQVLMIVNDARYGGSGGWISTSSIHSDAFELIRHELGHSFAGLVDEYWAGNNYAREGINMTQETNVDFLRWKNWYGDLGVGLYPHSESPTWYRPHQNCKMRYLGPAFCAVCKEGIIEKIHSLVSPLVSYVPASTNLNPSDYPISFKLNLIEPEPNTLQIKWTLNNSPFDLNTDSVKIESFELVSGSNNLSATIEDTTGLLRVDGHNQIHMFIVSWNVEKLETGIETLSSQKMNISIFPNPFQDYLVIKNEEELKENLKVEIVDMMGNILMSHISRKEEYCTINMSSLNRGFYMINLYVGEVLIATRKMVKN
ncbi:T9SS C-terminal target domain-containing protein [Maribellus luteus]|uniref:T9SS C-terminal target domain-containing protein n=1 Tax=Maribellus luteus TaxID=2305463 RepID=A0A399SQY3_9BACT|nr:M64 family metallopeptidase [Maribellus luteus]RIJ46160.1 T9SS C-terminal target domain-containing protein [Maribellus luteus]